MMIQFPTENHYETSKVESQLLNNKHPHRKLGSVLNGQEKSL